MKTDSKKLMAATAKARLGSVSPYSKFQVGACRQLLAEYAPKAKVFIADSANLKTIRTFTVKALLPAAFTLKR